MFSSQNSQVSDSVNYIEDVFATYLFTGTGANLTIANGLKNEFTNVDTTTTYTIPPSTSTNSVSLQYLTTSTITNSGNPPISTDSQATNGRSINTSKGGGYRPSSASTDYAYGTGDFCVEVWVKRTDAVGGRVFTHSDNAINVDIGADGSLSTYQFGGLSASANSVPLNAWTHIALTRSSGTGRLFVNGTQASSAAVTTNWSTSRQVHIGCNNGFSGGSFPGLVGDARVYKGSAKYTSNFTPATTLTTDTNVVLLASYNSSTTMGGTEDVVTTVQTVNKHVMSWGKPRNNGNYHAISDTLRGGDYALVPNTTESQRYNPETKYIKLLTTNGITLGKESDINGNGDSMVNWAFRQQAKFFDVVTYTGDGVTGRAVPHNLGSTPGCIIIKRLDSAQDFGVYHISGGQKLLQLNTANAWWSSGANYWYSTPTSTVFYPDNIAVADHYQNVNGASYVAYLFAHNAGGFGLNGTDNVISCGSYTGTGGAVEVNVGFEPQWIMFKSATAADNWRINDVMRGIPTGGADANLAADLSNAEYGTDNRVDVTSTGFIANASNSQSGVTHIYIAIRRGPMKVPTSGTSVFSPVASSANTGTITSGFPTDMVLSLDRTTGTSGYNRMAQDRLRGAFRILNTTTTDAEYVNATSASFASNSGIVLNGGSVYANGFVHEQFRRAPGFFDVVCYTGDGTASRAINHNLGVAPELIIKKSRSAATGPDWNTQAVGPLGYSSNLTINSSNSNTPNGITYLFATGNATTITTATNPLYINESGQTYVTYLFATCPGVSKVGSYTGTGATQTISCGFTGGARWVMIKRTDSTGDWYVWDTARGMVAGTDPNLQLNSASSQTNTNDVYTTTGGFQIVGTGAGINASGGTYIYLAIA